MTKLKISFLQVYLNILIDQEYTCNSPWNILITGSLTPLTRLALVNAVYFKGKWLNQFAVTKTQVQPFYLGSNEKTVDVQMMHHHAEYRHGDLEAFDARILELPYEVSINAGKFRNL